MEPYFSKPPPRSLPDDAPSAAYGVASPVFVVIGVLLFGLMALNAYHWMRGFFSSDVPARLVWMEPPPFGKSRDIKYACEAPSGEVIETSISVRDDDGLQEGQQTTGKIYPSFLVFGGPQCVAASTQWVQPFGFLFVTFVIFTFGAGAYGVGQDFRRSTRARWLLQHGVVLEGVIRSVTEKKRKGRVTSLVAAYEYVPASHPPVTGSILLFVEGSGWKNQFIHPVLQTPKIPHEGQALALLYHKEKPHQHIVVAICPDAA